MCVFISKNMFNSIKNLQKIYTIICMEYSIWGTKASEILSRLEDLNCRIVNPNICGKDVRFTVYSMSELESIEEWVNIAKYYQNQIDARVDTTGVHSNANFRIWVPKESIEFDIESGTHTSPTGHN